MNRCRSLAAVFLAALLAGSGPAAGAEKRLVPAQFAPVQDDLGFRWDLTQYGYVNNGSNCFNNAAMLQVNNSNFSAQRPLMTPDGREFVLSRDYNGIAITRHVTIDAKNSLCRYVDTFRNSTPQAQTITVELHLQFNNRMQAILTNTGSVTAGMFSLGRKENGIVAVRDQNSSPNSPSALWMLASPEAKVQPQISNEGNYRIKANFTLALAPGESASLLHVLAQRNLTGTPDSKSLAKLFAPLKSPRQVADLSSEERKRLVNFRGGQFFSSGEIAGLPSLLEEMEVDRGGFDILAVGTNTRLRGTAHCPELSVESQFGPVKIPLEKVAALLGGVGQAQVVLRDGQSLNGAVSAPDFAFSLTTGTNVDLDFKSLDRLVMRLGPDDGKLPDGAWGLLETVEGDRLALKATPGFKLRVHTAWGAREISLENLLAAGPSPEMPLGFDFALEDGSAFLAFLADDKLVLDTLLFGPREFPAASVRHLVAARAAELAETLVDAPPEAQVATAEDQVFTGIIDLPELHFVTAAGVLPVAPNFVRSLHNETDEPGQNPIFTAELWAGGSVSGPLRENVLPVRSGDAVLQIPVADVRDARVPAPAVPEGMREKIAALIRDLGDPDWEKREAASRELGELGPLARSPLQEASTQTKDPEVRRRAQALLDEI